MSAADAGGEDAQRSVAEDLEAAFDQVEGRADEETVSEKEETERRADKSKPAEAHGVADDAAEDDEEKTEAPGEAPQEPSPSPGVEPPEHWSAEDKARFAALPDEYKQWFVDVGREIERGAREKFEAAAEARRVQSELDEVFRPIEHDLRASGVTRVQAVRNLVHVHQALEADPGAALARLASVYASRIAASGRAGELVRTIARETGVDLSGTMDVAAQADDWLDPRAQTEIQTLKQELAAIRAEQERRAAEAEILTRQRAQAALDAFRDAQDERGNPRHPHFERVRTAMGALMQAAAATGRTLELEDAYKQAVWADPELRETMIQAQQAEAARKREAQRKEAVAKAKTASTPRTSAETSTVEEPAPTVYEELARLWPEDGARI